MSDDKAMVVQAPVDQPHDEAKALAKPAPTNLMTVSYDGIACAAFAKEEASALMAPVAATDIEIKPDGIVYFPEMCYRRVLHKAFGPGAWALRPVSSITNVENVVYREFALYIHGRFVGQAVGQNEYQPTNKQMTWGDCVEGAKSNALSRICKDIGIATELWDKSYIEKWKAEYAVKVWNETKQKFEWRRKDREPFFWEKKQTGAASGRQSQAQPIADQMADAMQKQGGGANGEAAPRGTSGGAPKGADVAAGREGGNRPGSTGKGSTPVSEPARSHSTTPSAPAKASPPYVGSENWPRMWAFWIGEVKAVGDGWKRDVGLSPRKQVGGSSDKTGNIFATCWCDADGKGEHMDKCVESRKNNEPMHVLLTSQQGKGKHAGKQFWTLEECEHDQTWGKQPETPVQQELPNDPVEPPFTDENVPF